MHGIKIRPFVLTFDLWLKIIPASSGLGGKGSREAPKLKYADFGVPSLYRLWRQLWLEARSSTQ